MALEEEEDTETLPAGTTLGRYQIVRLLGRGGMGAVYEGLHLNLKKRVAIKTLRPAVAAQPGARARFLREGEAASRIQHRHVVDVTDVGTADGVTYLVMEFLEGEDLGARLSRVGSLSVPEMLDIMLPVLAAIAVAHDEGVIHRDLKPENIFLTQTRHSGIEPKVLDFGISKISSRAGGHTLALTGTGASMGTPYYMAPEQIRSAGTVDARSDQYALGAIVYQCVTGRRAHEGETIYEVIRSVGDGTVTPPRVLRPDLPIDVERAILRAMRLQPADRFPSVRAFGQALLPFASAATRAQWAPALQVGASADLGERPPSHPGGTVMLPPPNAARTPLPRTAVSSPNTTFGASAAQITLRPPKRRAGAVITAVVLAGGGAVGAYALLSRPAPPAAARPPAVSSPADVTPPPPTGPTQYHVSVTAHPREADLELDGRRVGTGSFDGDLPLDGVQHTVTATAEGFVPARFSFRDSPPPAVIRLQPLPPTAAPPAPTGVLAHSRALHSPPHAHAGARPNSGAAPGRPSGPTRTENNAPIIDD